VALRKRYEMLLERRKGLAWSKHATRLSWLPHAAPAQLFNRCTCKEVQNCPHCNRLLYLGE